MSVRQNEENRYWNADYYDMIEFLYWEPQHIGKIKNHESRIKNLTDAFNRIRGKEVFLNHQLNLFFRLAPSMLLQKFVCTLFNNSSDELFQYTGRFELHKIVPNEITQPDLFLVGCKTNVGIELKIDANTNLEQIYKYAVLHHLEEIYSEKSKDFSFVLMGYKELTSYWRESYHNIEEIIGDLQKFQISDKLLKGTKNIDSFEWERVKEIIRAMNMSYCTYAELYEFLQNYKKSIDNSSEYADCVIKLISGLENELIERGLAQ